MAAGDYVPERGDIILTNFDPTRGKEQAHDRPALVLTISAFNKVSGLALVAPITSVIRGNPFEVPIPGEEVKGVVLCHQIRMIDYKARGFERVEVAPKRALNEVLEKTKTFLQ